MILKDKMFIVSSAVDDSIKSSVAVYDITIFRNFVEFEKYVNTTPVVLDTLIITTDELPFTASNMMRMQDILNSPFIKIKESILYLIDSSYNYKVVSNFMDDQGLHQWSVYQGELNIRFITDIVTGEGRQSNEGQTEIITYRMRADQYIQEQNRKRYENAEGRYYTDEDTLAGLPNEEEPENINPTVDYTTNVRYIVGEGLESTVLSFLLAQYLSMSGKTLIVEKDWEYHTLTELATKAGIEFEYIDIKELVEDVSRVLNRIKNTQSRLIVVGSKSRYKYVYSFIWELLEANLAEHISNIIRECDYDKAPYGRKYTIVMPNTVPDVLRCCSSLVSDVDTRDVTFVGLQLNNLGPMNISSKEMESIISIVLEKNNVTAQVVRVNGIKLKGEDVVYDLLSILNSGNTR